MDSAVQPAGIAGARKKKKPRDFVYSITHAHWDELFPQSDSWLTSSAATKLSLRTFCILSTTAWPITTGRLKEGHLRSQPGQISEQRWGAQDQLENPKRCRLYKSRARLRSQELLASSQSSRERTLARARAIEQSAAP